MQTEALTPGSQDAALEREARAWMTDPVSHFGHSLTRMQSLSVEAAEAVQLAAMNIRLAEQRQVNPVLAKLADTQGIRQLDSVNDIAPLLFEHTYYKSYPVSLLSKRRFDRLNQWLDGLTNYDISPVDVSHCQSIDDWLVTLQRETPLDPATSSGTTGTMSFFPKSKHDYTLTAQLQRVQILQQFGTEPTDRDLNDKIHVINPFYKDGHSSTGRFGHYFVQALCKGDESYFHCAFPYKMSADLLWLAARLRAAAARGDLDRVDVPESLLARRGELEEMHSKMPALQKAFIENMLTELRGKRVYAGGLTSMWYEIARKGLEDGYRSVLSPDSIVMGGGGAKGMVLPDDAEETILEFFGVPRMISGYGMTEVNTQAMICEHDRYHFAPWLTVLVLDRDTGEAQPRRGMQTGRAAFYDMTHDGTWGGIITGDRIAVGYDGDCPCGRSTVYVDGPIQRFSELEGGDDKITCAATPAAQAEALDFLREFEL